MKEWFTEISGELERLFTDKPIVLVDVGASGAPPQVWRDLSSISCYVGFDPDLRELHEDNSFGFGRYVMLNKAVADSDQKELTFYLTTSPYCSSSLKPNFANLGQYSFTDLFHVEKTTTVPATRLDSALREIRVNYIDWLKLDTQGKDLDIYRSLDGALRNPLLVLDIEPGVTDFYQGENTFSQAHAYLLENGYWLSKASFQENPRISKSTRERLAPQNIDLQRLPGNPTAVEAQYCRTLAHLISINAGLRDYVCFWVLSMVNNNHGFALDVAAHLVERGLGDNIGTLLIRQTVAEMERQGTHTMTLKSMLKSWVPSALHPIAGKVVAAVRAR